MRRALALLLVAASGALAADPGFEELVRGIESHYGVRRVHIPLLGTANLFLKLARPAGASGFRLAVFENLDSSAEYGDAAGLDALMGSLAAHGLTPLVRVHSRSRGQSTYIFSGTAAKTTTLLIATFERRDATVVEVQADAETLMKILAAPDRAGDAFALSDDSRDR